MTTPPRCPICGKPIAEGESPYYVQGLTPENLPINLPAHRTCKPEGKSYSARTMWENATTKGVQQ